MCVDGGARCMTQAEIDERQAQEQRARDVELERQRAAADRLRREREAEQRRLDEVRSLAQSIESCRKFALGGCEAALRSDQVTPEERTRLVAWRATAEQFAAHLQACKAGSVAACDAALSFAAASSNDRTMLRQWRDEASVLHRTLSTTKAFLESGASRIGGSLQVIRDLPTSTHIAGGIAALFAATLLLIAVGRRPRRKVADSDPLEMFALKALQPTPPPHASGTHATEDGEPPAILLPGNVVDISEGAARRDWQEPRPAAAPVEAATSTPGHGQIASPPARIETTSSRTAYLLNFLLPGAGNIYFGQPIVGTLFILGILFGLFLLVFGAGAAMIGMMIIVFSLIAAIFTFGLSLLIGLPIGFIFLMMGAGPVVAFLIWMFSLVTSQILVHVKVNRLASMPNPTSQAPPT